MSEMMHWYKYKSKDGNISGYALEKGKQEVARFVGYPREELIIKPAVWVLEELSECGKS